MGLEPDITSIVNNTQDTDTGSGGDPASKAKQIQDMHEMLKSAHVQQDYLFAKYVL